MVYSIIIINYNTKNFLKQCLNSLFSLKIKENYEVIVVDVGSTDGSVLMLKRNFSLDQFPRLKLVCSPTNIGHAAASNLGILESSGKYLIFLNTDIVFFNNPFSRFFSFLENNPAIGVFGPKLLNPDKTIQHTCFNYYRLLTPLFRRLIGQNSFWGRRELDRFLIKDFDRLSSREVPWVIDSFLVARRDVMEKIGGYDEQFFLYFSDLDLCLRIWQAGCKVYFFHDSGDIVHYYCRSSQEKGIIKSIINQYTRIHLKDFGRFLFKWRRQWRDLL